MKRIIALAIALALLALGAPIAACAEELAGTVVMSELSVSAVSNGRSKSVQLRDLTLTLELGSAEGVPTLQMCLDNGKGQQVDGIVQFVDSLMLISVGGVSGTYYVDLESVASEAGRGMALARSVGGALTLAGGRLDALLYALTTRDSSGVRTMELNLPDELYMPVAESLLPILEAIEEEDAGMDGLFDRVEDLEGGALFRLRYDPAKERIELALTKNGSGAKLAAKAAMSVEEAYFVDISADEMKYDLMNLDPVRELEMKGELAIIALKFGKFALGSGLTKLFP